MAVITRGLIVAALLAVSSAWSFCHDGVELNVTKGTNVTITWVQAPFFSTVPHVGHFTALLKLFHSAIVFRQELGDNHTEYWTLEFDFARKFSIDHVLGALIPAIVDHKLEWNSDARWCLRKGIYHGRAHWSKTYVDVATITPDQFLHIVYDYVPRVNGTGPGTWPQYQFFGVKDVFGHKYIDDVTCTDSYRVIQYVRDDLHVPVKNMVFKATRVTMTVLNMFAEREPRHRTMNWGVKTYYTALNRAVEKKFAYVEKMLAIFEFFLPDLFMHDNNRKQYFSVLAATPMPGLIFNARYEEIEDLQSHAPAKLPECGISVKCFYRMKQVCNFGGGLPCNICVDVWYAKFLLIDGCPPIETLLLTQACFCGETMPAPEKNQTMLVV